MITDISLGCWESRVEDLNLNCVWESQEGCLEEVEWEQSFEGKETFFYFLKIYYFYGDIGE